MKIIFSSIAVVAACLLPASVQAGEEEDLCQIYGELSQSVSEFLLPLTMREMVEMMSGQDNELMGQFAQSMLTGMSPETVGKLALADMKKIQLLSEHAGQYTIEMMMSGRISDFDKAGEAMETYCLSVGPNVIVDRMSASKRALGGPE